MDLNRIHLGTCADAQGGALCDPLGHVPPELAIHVLSYLTDAELAHAASVCRCAHASTPLHEPVCAACAACVR
jgi:hypothetical protein